MQEQDQQNEQVQNQETVVNAQQSAEQPMAEQAMPEGDGGSREPVPEDKGPGTDQPAADVKAEDPVATPAPTDAPVVIPTPVAPTSVPPVPKDDRQLSLGCSPATRLTIDELKYYVEQMSGRVRLPNDEGGRIQSNLYHTLQQLVHTPTEDFTEAFGLGLRIIKDNLRGVFSEINIHRYTPYVNLPAAKAGHMRHLINALTALADPSIRKEALRVVNVDLAFPTKHVKEEARQRVLEHLGV